MKRYKKLLALLMVFAMVAGMTACGSKDEGGTNNSGQSGAAQAPTVAESLGFGYVSEYTALNAELDWVNTTSAVGENMYFCGECVDEERGQSVTKLYGVSAVDGSMTEIPLPELTHTERVTESVNAVQMCADGSGYYLVSYSFEFADGFEPAPPVPYDVEETVEMDEMPVVQEIQGDVPMVIPQAREGEAAEETEIDAEMDQVAEVPSDTEENLDETTETAEEGIMPISEPELPADYQEPRTWYTVYHCDMSGNVIDKLDLSDLNGEEEYFYINSIVVDGNGDVLLTADTKIMRFAPDGTRKDDVVLEENGYVSSLASSADGTVLAVYYGEMGQEICRINGDGTVTKLSLEGDVSDWGYALYPGNGSDMLLSDGKKLFHLNTQTGKLTTVLNWLDSDINGSKISGLAAYGEDKIMVLLNQWSANGGRTTYELGVLTKTPLEEIPEKIPLTLGATYLSTDYTDTVINFNRTNGKYRITLVDYSAYNTDEDYMLGEKQLDLDVVSGNAPDIINLSSGNARKYIGKGVLVNLNEFLEKDDELSIADFVPGALAGYSAENGLYGIPTSFSLQGLCASRELVGDATSWTMEDLYNVIQKLPGDTELMSYYTGEDFLDMMLMMNLSAFVDYSKASCSFDSDSFKRMLEIAAKFPTEFPVYEDDVWMDDLQKLQLGLTLMSGSYLSSPYDVKRYYGLYQPENGLVAIGYPMEDGNGLSISLDGGMAISSGCKNQEGAWEFIRMMISEENQRNTVWSFPVRQSVFDEKLKETMEEEFYLDEKGEKVYYDSVEYIGDKEFSLPALTEAQVNDFRERVNHASISGTYDQDLFAIIHEEAAAFFAGDKSVDDVASLIQNRVSIYLGENS